jgi:hypothetical protein
LMRSQYGSIRCDGQCLCASRANINSDEVMQVGRFRS